MRIIAGEYRSRRILAPEGMGTRPTPDKVREAVFSSLGGMFGGGVFLDLYAGSGANGLEAISRGCERAVFSDISGRACRVIRQNIESLGCGDKTEVYRMKDTALIAAMAEEKRRFNYVYLDPPYALQKNMTILDLLQRNELLAADAEVVIESAAGDIFPETAGSMSKVKEAVYGTIRISYYRRR